ncbi:MAG: 16S rRNA (cytosine(1402)-N(4))-methyltransferase RsmH, partial [Bacilli bacterium]|nr:16S rRNA (cytosine(1402)-N(4))-methyltransferase RsmH [Bacilli bacterium]
CFEQDPYAREKGREKLEKISNNFTIIPQNFVNLRTALGESGIYQVDGVLYDLGVSSFQFDIPDRGFSYNYDAPLDMRMNTTSGISAYDIVNTYSFNELKNIFYRYGEEKYSANIARMIEKERAIKPITTTYELVDVIKKSLPASVLRKKGHPAKQVFQALRIAVNDELEVFEKSLTQALSLLKSNGRIAVITFHSLEDRICKNIFKEKTEIDIPRGLPIKESEILREFELVNKKVIVPDDSEIATNHRSHSAKLRVIKKL